jgi:hypothetical protein
MERIWKKIPGYSLYEVSKYGEIKTFNWKNKGIEKIMKPALDACGYLRTVLKRDFDGKLCTVKVHRMVALSFLENPENKPMVNHKNGIRNDNRVSNLEWCTNSENIKHSFTIGLSSNKGSKNPSATLTEEQAQEILDNYEFGKKSKKGITKKQLAEKYNTTINVISFLVQRRTWKHLSCKYQKSKK